MNIKKGAVVGATAGLIAVFGPLGTGSAAAAMQATIDFEGLSAGDVVTVLSAGSGISGADLGTVGVTGDGVGSDEAMIFDATCGGGGPTACSGGDDDLLQPEHGNVLIVSEDGDSSDPDDHALGQSFTFDFSGWGPGVLTVVSIDVLDIDNGEEGGLITVDGQSVAVPVTGDGGIATVPLNLTGSSMEVALVSSGAIDNIVIEVADDLADGRMTGGGNQIRLADQVRITQGLTVHCDLLLSNNLEVNWPGGNKFHMTEHLETVECSDDPNIIQAPPPAPLDTLIGIGTGRFNGVDGFTIEFVLVDAGEPGTGDQVGLLIYETANPANVALDVPLQTINGGNIQAHYDQPHS